MNQKRRQELKQIVLGARRPTLGSLQKKRRKNQVIQGSTESETGWFPVFSLGLYNFETREEKAIAAKQIQKDIHYAINKLKPPPQQIVSIHSINIAVSGKKILFLDLDETLIWTNCASKKAGNYFVVDGVEFYFSVRPFCRHFLKKMSQLFDIYIFTAGTKTYAKPIVQFLNEGADTIKGLLHRGHCLKTKNGVFVKDLRIFNGPDLKDMVIVDNSIRSFSFQLQNGVPVQSYRGDPEDRVLLKLSSFLTQVSKAENIPKFLASSIRIRQSNRRTQTQGEKHQKTIEA